MAFPTIQGADTKNGTVTSNSNSWTLTYPTNLVSGDLILGFCGIDGTPSISSLPAGFGWDRFPSGASIVGCYWKSSDGNETGTFSLGLSASEQGGWRIFRVTNWFGGTLGTGDQSGGGSQADGFALAIGATGASSTPDPPSLNPTNWATEDTLWFATCGVDTSRTISVFPLADNQSSDVSGGAGGATLGLCTTNSAVASLDPGTFTISASDDWAATTVAVRPAAAAGDIFGTEERYYLQAVNRSNVY